MKRILTVLTTLLLAVVLCCSFAFASGNTYYLEEMDADIALPSWDDYYYLYPNMPADNEDLAYLEITPEEINAILVPNGILFDALFYDASHEIAVQVNGGTDDLDYSELNELERAAVIAATTMELESLGYTVNGMEWDVAENATWLVVEFTHPDVGWAYQYHTNVNGKVLVFTASSAQGVELTDEIRTVTANMALGTVFHSGDSVIAEPDDPAAEPVLPTVQPDDSDGEVAGMLAGFDAGRIVVGALIGAGAGVVVVAILIVLLAVKGRRKGKHEEEA